MRADTDEPWDRKHPIDGQCDGRPAKARGAASSGSPRGPLRPAWRGASAASSRLRPARHAAAPCDARPSSGVQRTRTRPARGGEADRVRRAAPRADRRVGGA